MYALERYAAVPGCRHDIAQARIQSNSLDNFAQELEPGVVDKEVLGWLLSDVPRFAKQLSPKSRTQWLAALHEAWRCHHWEFDPERLGRLMQLATRWCDWPLAVAAGKALSALRALSDSEALLWMEACQHMGDMEKARDIAVSRQLSHPNLPQFYDAYADLLAWNTYRNHFGWVDGRDWNDAELLLEPLGHHHLPDFAWQYHDPAIAERCCLPSFGSDQQWHCWLEDSQRFGDQWTGAVIHREWGFIGSVSLILHGGLGFFYYWFGPDFQGQGFGPRAVALLLASAQERYGLHTCYAKVFEDNLPSRRALEKLGFEDIGVSAIAPDDKEIFYRRGAAVERRRMAEELHWLMGAMASGTRPAILLRANP